ncbi:trimeric intracellular cation channel family protein [Dietzia sp. B32]|uniref:trimeric intracellular cation channel family protein n=1 Tax=Dietzia sp. B32 TaxID=2915130 RepID=UPI0021AD7082|nr:trimeric intracellular cation channel family protein [Dietzia sp. B32]UVE94410.1 trimeric intracellular cation channel family protein [Dietzia sp. B32]
MEFLTILFLIGITAEAMTGALAAGRERMDLFGVVIVACVTAIGGGSIRDVLLGHYPLIWVEHPSYLALVALAAVVTVVVAPIMRHFRVLFLGLDALGLTVFAIFGARIALEMGHGVIIAVAAAVITGVFGGVMRDLLCDRVPLVFRQELYASVAILAALVYVGLTVAGVPENWGAAITLVVGFGLRVAAIRFKLGLPVFDYYQEAERRPRGRRRHRWSIRGSSEDLD